MNNKKTINQEYALWRTKLNCKKIQNAKKHIFILNSNNLHDPFNIGFSSIINAIKMDSEVIKLEKKVIEMKKSIMNTFKSAVKKSIDIDDKTLNNIIKLSIDFQETRSSALYMMRLLKEHSIETSNLPKSNWESLFSKLINNNVLKLNIHNSIFKDNNHILK